MDPPNPLNSLAVLRIDYATVNQETEQPQIIGFRLAGARRWAERLADQAGIKLTVVGERKAKKASEIP